jgi:hypothetical protein
MLVGSTRYLPGAGFAQTNRSAPEHDVPNGGFSFDARLKFDGTNVTKTRIQYQPPSLVRYFTPQDDANFSAWTAVHHAVYWLCISMGTWGSINETALPSLVRLAAS